MCEPALNATVNCFGGFALYWLRMVFFGTNAQGAFIVERFHIISSVSDLNFAIKNLTYIFFI